MVCINFQVQNMNGTAKSVSKVAWYGCVPNERRQPRQWDLSKRTPERIQYDLSLKSFLYMLHRTISIKLSTWKGKGSDENLQAHVHHNHWFPSSQPWQRGSQSNQANNDGRIGERQTGKGKGKGKEKPLTVTTQPTWIDITTPNYLHNQEIPSISLT